MVLMMSQISIYSDYVCPYCLLAEAVVQQAIGDRQITIDWRAYELRPEPVPTLRPEDPYLPTIWRQSIYPLAEQFGIPIKLPTWSPQPRTRKAFELLAFAKERGLGHCYSVLVLKAFFQQDRDIGDQEVLIELAADAGLIPEEARQALESSTYAQHHRDALRHAREDMAITSVPTIVVGERVFRGIPPLEALRQAINRMGTYAAAHHLEQGETASSTIPSDQHFTTSMKGTKA